MKKTKDKATSLANKALAPLIKHAHRHKGTMAQVKQRMEKLTGEKCHRQLVEKWLHTDEKKRSEPRLGTGLFLLRIWSEIKKETGKAKRGK